jgi:hypothetical protein
LSASEPAVALSEVTGNARSLALRSKAKRQDKMPITLADSKAARSLEDQRCSSRTDCPPTPPPNVVESSRQSRRRTIMGRYVFGDELKPGERWRRRLLKDP